VPIIVYYGQVLCHVKNQTVEAIAEDGDVIWYRADEIKSEPDWGDKGLGLHDKYGCKCGGYLRIVYSYFLQDHVGLGRKEAHNGFCGECGAELRRNIPHKINLEKLGELKMPFGKHKGVAFKDIPIDYLKWCADNLKDNKIAKKIDCYLKDQANKIAAN